jgi:hypothetical protein
MPCPVRGIVVFKRVYRHYIIRTVTLLPLPLRIVLLMRCCRVPCCTAGDIYGHQVCYNTNMGKV